MALLALLLTACAGGPQVTPAGTPAVTLELSAVNSVFDKSSLTVPAGAPFAIVLDNRDTVPHNVSITGGPPGSTGELFGGPARRAHVFPALSAGSYRFKCDLHPEMTGTLTAD